ncbi:hypothetical protein HK097_009060 [Rhizophlyctis rosea]|uniref:Uncharacterized protein n=1 Tax=Rhizophlyctis rosea TaxID=64517 RepID=A0AAD5SBN6_9FUNG|nr:hypothetical protein HK097_009060 [Rhizophlyctis rosea]
MLSDSRTQSIQTLHTTKRPTSSRPPSSKRPRSRPTTASSIQSTHQAPQPPQLPQKVFPFPYSLFANASSLEIPIDFDRVEAVGYISPEKENEKRRGGSGRRRSEFQSHVSVVAWGSDESAVEKVDGVGGDAETRRTSIAPSEMGIMTDGSVITQADMEDAWSSSDCEGETKDVVELSASFPYRLPNLAESYARREELAKAAEEHPERPHTRIVFANLSRRGGERLLLRPATAPPVMEKREKVEKKADGGKRGSEVRSAPMRLSGGERNGVHSVGDVKVTDGSHKRQSNASSLVRPSITSHHRPSIAIGRFSPLHNTIPSTSIRQPEYQPRIPQSRRATLTSSAPPPRRPRRRRRAILHTDTLERLSQLQECDQILSAFARHNILISPSTVHHAILRPENVITTAARRAPPKNKNNTRVPLYMRATSAGSGRPDSASTIASTSSEPTPPRARSAPVTKRKKRTPLLTAHHLLVHPDPPMRDPTTDSELNLAPTTTTSVTSLTASSIMLAKRKPLSPPKADARTDCWWRPSEYRALKRKTEIRSVERHLHSQLTIKPQPKEKPFNAYITAPKTAPQSVTKCKPSATETAERGRQPHRFAYSLLLHSENNRPRSASTSLFVRNDFGNDVFAGRRRTQSENPGEVKSGGGMGGWVVSGRWDLGRPNSGASVAVSVKGWDLG